MNKNHSGKSSHTTPEEPYGTALEFVHPVDEQGAPTFHVHAVAAALDLSLHAPHMYAPKYLSQRLVHP